MAVSFSEPGITEPIAEPVAAVEYLDCPCGPDLTVGIHLDAVDGIAHDVVEGVKSMPRRGVEVGGLLLGALQSSESGKLVRIERYQRLDCGHRFGPQFALDETEMEALEGAADSLGSSGDLSVMGFYRSNTRANFHLESSDLEIASRFFPDPGDLLLLIQPLDSRDIKAQFYVRGISGDFAKAGDEFAFRGRVIGPVESPGDSENLSEPQSAVVPDIAPERPRRLVPDFLPAGEAGGVVLEEDAAPLSAFREPASLPASPEIGATNVRKWWPLAGALALVGGAIFFLWQSRPGDVGSDAKDAVPVVTPAESQQPIRPVGLYVDPTGSTWRISWNPGATALQGARSVSLFVREGEDQSRIELTQKDLQSGTYQFQPKASQSPVKDVTFRLEAADAAGHLNAESFRLIHSLPAASPVPSPKVPAAAPAVAYSRAIHKVAPVVPASIRPRIHGSLPIDVRVRIDSRGRVLSAVPVPKPRPGLPAFLAQRAVAAARQWRFEPRESTETIHFVF